jgi:hypothetical protein
MNKAGGASATRGTPLEPSPKPARTHQGTAGAPDSSRAQRIFHKSPARQVTSLGDARHAGASGCLAGTSLDASLRSYGMRRTVFGPIARFKDASPVAVSQERCNNRHGAPSGWGLLCAAHPRRQGRRMGEEKRRSSVRRKEPFAPLSSSAAPPVSRLGGRFSTRAGGTGSGAFGKKRASPTLFAFGVREEASLRVAVVCRWQRVAGRWTQRRCVPTFLGKPFCSGRPACLRGGFASGTSRRRELGAHGAG